MTNLAEPIIYSLPYPVVSPSENAILNSLLSELQALREEVQNLKDTVTRQDGELSTIRLQLDTLEARQDASQRRVATISDVQDEICDKIDEHAEALNMVWKAVKTTPSTAETRGKKTLARIAKIDEILKTRGPTTLKELERLLKIDRATMTRLLKRLDMRRYEIHRRPGDEREKVLRFRAQIS